jgi:CheY-like chemotaxis protein
MRLLEPCVVVLVHPDEDNREMDATFLRLHGLEVLTFADADAGLRVAPAADVIVTGIRLRGLFDGVQLIGRIRCDDRTRDTPIIVVTASPPGPYRAHAEAAGCNRFLSMPCLPEDLLHEVESLIAPGVSSRRRRSTETYRETEDAGQRMALGHQQLVQPRRGQLLLPPGPPTRLGQQRLHAIAHRVPHRPRPGLRFPPHRYRLGEVLLDRQPRNPQLLRDLPLGAAFHQHFVTNDMDLIHSQHPPSGPEADASGQPPSGLQVDHFPSGEWITFRAARPACPDPGRADGPLVFRSAPCTRAAPFTPPRPDARVSGLKRAGHGLHRDRSGSALGLSL